MLTLEGAARLPDTFTVDVADRLAWLQKVAAFLAALGTTSTKPSLGHGASTTAGREDCALGHLSV
jgi:hypothetical protein